ncbi:MAG: DUF4097 family beta strand repeat protein [Lachnospiraceae bacterium]|nr:DUF4097 family beta strand repeat protein [Lachnospiraceae bacterium]
MSRGKKWITAAFILLGSGVLVCFITVAVLGFDFKRLSTVQYVTNTYDVGDDFKDIAISADIEDITFVLSEDGKCRVVCYEEEGDPHEVKIQGDTLSIVRSKKWKWNVGIIMDSPEITVYLPNSHYGTLTVDGDTGSVLIPGDFSFEGIDVKLDTGNISCKASVSGDISVSTDTGHIAIAELSASGMILISDTGGMDISDVELEENISITEGTGRVVMNNVSCRNFASDGDTGSLNMTNVIASDEFNLERDTGNIEFNHCDAGTIYVSTDTGTVTGTLLTDKVFIVETDTGSVDVPKTITGGRCEITTDTGNIRITVERKQEP